MKGTNRSVPMGKVASAKDNAATSILTASTPPMSWAAQMISSLTSANRSRSFLPNNLKAGDSKMIIIIIIITKRKQVTEQKNCGWEELAHDALDWVIASGDFYFSFLLE